MKKFSHTALFFGITIYLIVSGSVCAQGAERVSVDSSGAQVNNASTASAISLDGRYIAFQSIDNNLVAGDTNGTIDIFVHDRDTGETTRVSVDSSGAQVNGNSQYPAISSDGRYIAFQSNASNLVGSDTNGVIDIFVHDCDTGETRRVSVNSNGNQANGDSRYPAISQDGQRVVFESNASNLVDLDTNGVTDIFVHDCDTGETIRVSVSSDGSQANGNSLYAVISGDGRCVAFESNASNLISGDTNGNWDIFAYNFQVLPDDSGTDVDNDVDGGGGGCFVNSIITVGGLIITL